MDALQMHQCTMMHAFPIFTFQVASATLQMLDLEYVIRYWFHIEGCVTILLNGVELLFGNYLIVISVLETYQHNVDHKIKRNSIICVMHLQEMLLSRSLVF